MKPEDARPVAWCCLLAFVTLMSYGLLRSAADSLLLAEHGKDIMPWAYGAVATAALVAVVLYGHLAGRQALGTVHATVALLSCALLGVVMILRAADVPFHGLLLYVWKDVYIVLLVELFWSIANTALAASAARWAYGLFCACGSVGDLAGSWLSSSLAPRIGSANLPVLGVPVLLVIALVGTRTARACGWPRPDREPQSWSAMFGVLRRSGYVRLLVTLIVIIQIATTLIDYNYRALGLAEYPDLDARTVVFSRVDMLISGISLGLQLCSGVIATLLGLRLLLLALPLVVGGVAVAFWAKPVFAIAAALKVVNKTVDYSLFRTSKEMLYRPLDYQEQVQGKAAADVLGYRAAKGGASALLWSVSGAIGLAALSTVIGIGLWALVVYYLIRNYRSLERA